MADEENTTEETGKSGGGMMKIILIVNAVLLLLAVAVGVTYFLMSGNGNGNSQQDSEVLPDAAPAADKPAEHKGGTPIYVPLNPAFVVNFENQQQVSFLQVDVQVMTYDPAVEEALKIHMPRVRNALLLLFGGKQYHEINTREGKRKLAQEAIEEIKKVLQEVGAPDDVEALYFTSFVMQ